MKRLSSSVFRSLVSLSAALVAGGCGLSSPGDADSVRNLSADRGGGAVRALQKKAPRILFNNDGTFILGNGVHGGRPLTGADVRAYVDLVTNTPVTTYIICMNSSMPYIRAGWNGLSEPLKNPSIRRRAVCPTKGRIV